MEISCNKTAAAQLLILTMIFAQKAHAATTALPDSILNEDYIYKYIYTDRDRSEQIMREMRRREILPLWELDYTEGDLESRHVQSNDTLQMELLYRQISCHDWLHNESSKMRCVKLLMNLARKTGHRPMESIALFNMGKSLYYHRETMTETRLKPKNATSYSANSTTTSAATTILSGQYDEIFRISLPRERLLIERQDTVNYGSPCCATA